MVYHTRSIVALTALLIALTGCGDESRAPAANATPAPTQNTTGGQAKPATATAGSAKPAGAAAKAPAKAKPAAKVEGPDEFALMEQELTWTADQKSAFKTLVAQRASEMSAFTASADGKQLATLRAKRDAANDAQDAAAAGKLDAEIAPLYKKEQDLRTTWRTKILTSLTPGQQDEWIAQQLWTRYKLSQRYGRLHLTETETATVRAALVTFAGTVRTPDLFTKDPYLGSLKAQTGPAGTYIEAKALNDAQRAKLATPRGSAGPASAAPIKD